MSNRLFKIEMFFVLLLVLLIILWVIFPNKNWEPWVILCGVLPAVLELFRRYKSTKESNPPSLENPVSELNPDSWKEKISEIRAQKYGAENVDIIEATNIALEAFGIYPENVRTTGGETGVRIWLSKPHSSQVCGLLHDEIVALHGKPISMDIRDYLTEDVYYTGSRPPMLQAKA